MGAVFKGADLDAQVVSLTRQVRGCGRGSGGQVGRRRAGQGRAARAQDGTRRRRCPRPLPLRCPPPPSLARWCRIDPPPLVAAVQVVAQLPGNTFAQGRDTVNTRTINTLLAYRKFCATSSSSMQVGWHGQRAPGGGGLAQTPPAPGGVHVDGLLAHLMPARRLHHAAASPRPPSSPHPTSTSVGCVRAQLILPEALKLLPLYSLAILKCVALRPDVRGCVAPAVAPAPALCGGRGGRCAQRRCERRCRPQLLLGWPLLGGCCCCCRRRRLGAAAPARHPPVDR